MSSACSCGTSDTPRTLNKKYRCRFIKTDLSYASPKLKYIKVYGLNLLRGECLLIKTVTEAPNLGQGIVFYAYYEQV